MDGWKEGKEEGREEGREPVREGRRLNEHRELLKTLPFKYPKSFIRVHKQTAKQDS